MTRELKWTKVTNQKFEEYKTFVDFFIKENKKGTLHFNCMIFDNRLIDHNKYSEGNKEVGFYKLYYQLLLRCFGRHYGVIFITRLGANSQEAGANSQS